MHICSTARGSGLVDALRVVSVQKRRFGFRNRPGAGRQRAHDAGVSEYLVGEAATTETPARRRVSAPGMALGLEVGM